MIKADALPPRIPHQKRAYKSHPAAEFFMERAIRAIYQGEDGIARDMLDKMPKDDLQYYLVQVQRLEGFIKERIGAKGSQRSNR